MREVDVFETRHIGPCDAEQLSMLQMFGHSGLDRFIDDVIPRSIRGEHKLDWASVSEADALKRLRRIAERNVLYRSYIGMGYYNCITPPVIQRNILENPGWYTQYTPYQAEIAQGRLEALFNFQTMVCDLVGLPVANASLLDEATAAAEAMALSRAKAQPGAATFLVSELCHPQTIAVVKTRAAALGIKVVVASHDCFEFGRDVFGILLQYPASDGRVLDYRRVIEHAHGCGALATVATDLLALCLLRPPGELGADIVIGSSQRFGIPLGYGGPHAAFFAVRDDLKRLMPGRVVGLSVDAHGAPALRLALQTREQHIRREKATSNICTAQVLLAVMASMYAVYHGPSRLKAMAKRVNAMAASLARACKSAGIKVWHDNFFDTLRVSGVVDGHRERCEVQRINLREYGDGSFGISVDETVTRADLEDMAWVLCGKKLEMDRFEDLEPHTWPAALNRTTEYLQYPIFNSHHSETEFLRYVRSLESRDLSLAFSMIPLGSCTMKLNATSEMLPVSWTEFSSLHPFAPATQAQGYRQLIGELENYLKEATGFSAVSFQPNSGAQGEYTGLLVIRAFLERQGQGQRRVCLIPRSAHGTNPASATMAGLEVVAVECDERGNIDIDDFKRKLSAHGPRLAAFMVTYPSTHGVFEKGIRELCDLTHAAGGQVYLDGANLNALVGLCRPLDLGADLCHINLHKTFCIPHGGGGPGMGPIAVARHLAPFLPAHPCVPGDAGSGIGPVAASPWGSAGILAISWVYMTCMGGSGLRKASQVAILNANYIAKRLAQAYPVLYQGENGFVAHECILDLRTLERSSGVKVEDVAKRLMDYGFHAPTVSWPVAGTMMIEPTESESKAELDRFCEAMLAIREEIREVEQGKANRENNLLKNSPHTALSLAADPWPHPYSREKAVFPASWTKERKFWPAVGRIDNTYGDRHLVCTCSGVIEG